MEQRNEGAAANRTQAAMWYWMPILVCFIGLFSIALLLLVNSIHEEQRINSLIGNAVMDVEIHAATAHILLEEAVREGETGEEVLTTIDEAIELADIIARGGESEHGLIPAALRDPDLRPRAGAVRSALDNLRTLAGQCLRSIGKGDDTETLYRRFEKEFRVLLDKGEALDREVARKNVAAQAKSARLFVGVILAWTAIIVTATVGLWNRERRRRNAEEELLQTHEQVLAQTEELKERTQQLVEAQEELVHREKLAFLGQLAANVGNELRNPLGVMNNAIFFLKTVQPEADDTVQEYLGIIDKEIDNSLKIVTDFLDFAQTKTPLIERVPARALIAASLARCAIPENIELRDEVPQSLPPLKVDPEQIGQVLQNLIVNSVQAMPAGGTLTLRGDRNGNGQVRLEVIDTGEGISPENMKHLFQPLFTTKSRGIGLGLVICRNLIEAGGGRIEVESEVGKGTTFSLLLPGESGEAEA